ncbi:MAG TPA: phosphatase PAP2 family protein [Candidatus Eisenbacteria bacterium]
MPLAVLRPGIAFAMLAGFAMLGATVLTELVTWLVGRPHPATGLVYATSQAGISGFPSGHLLALAPFVGFLCYLACARMTPSWGRTALIVLFLISIAMMGPARIYDSGHWTSSVLGSYLLGSIWLAAAIGIYHWGRRRKEFPSTGMARYPRRTR